MNKPSDELDETEFVAMNIVHQIGDVLYEALPKDIAHKYFMTARQATNDIAIEFAKKLILDRERKARLAELKTFAVKAGSYKDDYDIYPDIEKRIEALTKEDYVTATFYEDGLELPPLDGDDLLIDDEQLTKEEKQ